MTRDPDTTKTVWLSAALRPGRVVVLWGLAMALLAPAPVRGAESSIGWYGNVGFVAPQLLAALPPGVEVEIGTSAYVGLSVETTTPDVNPDPAWGDYPGAILGWTLHVGELVFTNDPNGPLNRIEVLLDPSMSLYWPTSSVVATPPLAGISQLEADVFFQAMRSDALSTDELPPLPPEPADWNEAVTGIIDATTGVVLIDIDLKDTCIGECQPLIASVPLPEWTTWGIGIVLLLAGTASLYSKQSALRGRWISPDGSPGPPA